MFAVMIYKELRHKSIGLDRFLAIITRTFSDSKMINGMRFFTLIISRLGITLLLGLVLRQTFFPLFLFYSVS